MEKNWLSSKIVEVANKSSSSNLCKAIVLNTNEFWSIAETSVGPMALSEDFKADLIMQKSCWFYHVETK